MKHLRQKKYVDAVFTLHSQFLLFVSFFT